MRVIVMLSGGIDSSTCLYIAKERGAECHVAFFDYGQRHKVEEKAAHRIANAAGVEGFHIIPIHMPWQTSSLTNPDMEVPKEGVGHEIPDTYVPARNIIFLSYCLGLASDIEADVIYAGMNAVDYSGYPDCRPEFIESFQRAANEGMNRNIVILTPVIKRTKAAIIDWGSEMGVPYEKTWSCYDPHPTIITYGAEDSVQGTAYVHCGLCDSCRIRKAGFLVAGLEDPTEYLT